jgi:hypothetical protein
VDPENTALPTGDTAAAGEQSNNDAAAAQPNEQQHEATGAEQGAAEGGEQAADGEGDKPGKKEKTPEQREIERLRRRVDNLTKQKYQLQGQQQQEPRQQQGTQGSEDEPVTLTRAELQKMIAEQAKELAPAVKEQQAEVERRQGVIASLSKQWGKEEFDAKASELDDAFGGLVDRSGRPKPATDAIFDADDPKAVIEYLTDPDNAEEAERISRMPATQAGRAIAKLEVKLAEAKKNAKPQPSRAARPIESVKGGGVPSGMPDPSNTKAYIAWANAQERAAR